MKKKNLWIIALVAIITIGIIACKEDEPDPQPTAQSKDITIATGKTVTINYTAIPNTTPSWWDKLESALKDRQGGFAPGNFTLNVTTSGTDGFVAGVEGSGTATVSEAFLLASDFQAIRLSIAGALTYWGVAPNTTP